MAAIDVDSHRTKDYFARRDRQLLTAINSEYARRRRVDRMKLRAKACQGDRPQTPGDMSIKGTSREGKKIYSWTDAGQGRVEVEATPRSLRLISEPGANKHRAAMARETTPVRALRKMLAKLGRMRQKAAKGEHAMRETPQ